jgi:hypothetical protein
VVEVVDPRPVGHFFLGSIAPESLSIPLTTPALAFPVRSCFSLTALALDARLPNKLFALSVTCRTQHRG